MKKVFFCYGGVLLITIGILISNSCRKTSRDNTDSEGRYSIPTSFPIFSSLQEVNDHRTYLAWGLANAFFNPSVGVYSNSATPIFVNLNASTTKEKVFLTEIVNTNSLNSYLEPSSMSTPELGDAIEWSVQNVPAPFALGTLTQFHPAAIIAFTNQTLDKASSYVEIVDYQTLSNTELNRDRLFCPRNVDQLGDLQYPVQGYYYNSNTSLMAVETFANEDDLEDQVDWLIHWVDYSWPVKLKSSASPNCDRPIVCGDDFCDMFCGEDDNNGCPTDCDMTRLKWLNWSEVKVEEDGKRMIGCSYESHREKFSAYNVACEGVIEHANGTKTIIGGTYDVKRKNIRLCRVRIGCTNTTCKNTSQVVNPNKLLNPFQKFDPLVDKIYLFFYEYDDATVGPDDKWEYDFNMEVITANQGSWTETFKVRSRHNPFGKLVKSAIPKNVGPNTIIKDTYSFMTSTIRPFYFVLIKPVDWNWDTPFTGSYSGSFHNLQFKFNFHS